MSAGEPESPAQIEAWNESNRAMLAERAQTRVGVRHTDPLTSLPTYPESARLRRATFFLKASVELSRAIAKFPGEEGVLTDAEWLAVLVEEVGECARAMQDETDERLQDELAQVAAMACRWALSIPAGRQRPPWTYRDGDRG